MCKWDHDKGMASNAIVLHLPDWCNTEKQNRTICVDKCISHVIPHLWAYGIETLANCCGHLHIQAKPSLVLPSRYNGTQLDEISTRIKEVDGREWQLQQWVNNKLTTTKGGERCVKQSQ